jgi:hypothetical protein
MGPRMRQKPSLVLHGDIQDQNVRTMQALTIKNQAAKVIFIELNKMWEGEGFYTQHSEMGVILQVGVRSFSCLRNRHNIFFSRRDIHEYNVASTYT